MSIDLEGLTRSFSSIAAALVTGDVDEREQHQVEHLLQAVARVRGAVDAVELACTARLRSISTTYGGADPAATLSRHGRTTGREGDRTVRRSQAADQVPQMKDLLADGKVSGDHLDVIAQAMSRLEPDERARLANEGAWIATIAANATPEELERALRLRVRQLSADDGVAKLQRQRRATTLRTWTDKDTGMLRLFGEFDPESGARLVRKLRRTVDALFRDEVPDTCPDDERKQGHLKALALLQLVCDGGVKAQKRSRGPVPEFIVLIDHKTLFDGVHAKSRIEVEGGLELPIETLRRHACMADIIPVVMGSNGVVLEVGRAARHATPAQRRALRAMYSCCAVPGCRVAFDDCAVHHIHWWHHGGPTDLDNLVPLCSKHHHCMHEGGWKLHLEPDDRVLTITLPDGTVHANAPPYKEAA